MLTFLQALGAFGMSQTSGLGRSGLFLLNCLRGLFRPPGKFLPVIKQVHFIGTKSLGVIFFTAVTVGMVLGLQGYYTLSRFGSESVLGTGVALSLMREMGPVLTGLMVTGRAGSAICAELGIMRIEEQIDALECMAIDPHSYLVSPRFLAGLIAIPLLTCFCVVVGIFGAYVVAVELLGVNAGAYLDGVEKALHWRDVHHGLMKSILFGGLIVWICSYKGYFAGVDRGSFGPEQVSRATTDAVVVTSVMILISDYLATSIM